MDPPVLQNGTASSHGSLEGWQPPPSLAHHHPERTQAALPPAHRRFLSLSILCFSWSISSPDAASRADRNSEIKTPTREFPVSGPDGCTRERNQSQFVYLRCRRGLVQWSSWAEANRPGERVDSHWSKPPQALIIGGKRRHQAPAGVSGGSTRTHPRPGGRSHTSSTGIMLMGLTGTGMYIIRRGTAQLRIFRQRGTVCPDEEVGLPSPQPMLAPASARFNVTERTVPPRDQRYRQRWPKLKHPSADKLCHSMALAHPSHSLETLFSRRP
ncbi:heparan sulfate (glucosamine) 3-O-sulfotransferase 3-like protein [Lates japonicus]|uniref:Heparan sulfate (Glucosamine) 3-O-sulfotransferase 3-like protein n=1 Tax=Lates japonicus TaxID=270547 RepID=A0AAD3NH89_LATJO|nr:heparan sulfate (glucosamine) 3-O-sulfotransferase 3-like protein [Lates japonicus]